MSSFPLGVVSVGHGKIFSVYECRNGVRCGFFGDGPMWRLPQEGLVQEDVDNTVKFLLGKVVDDQPSPLLLGMDGDFGAKALL